MQATSQNGILSDRITNLSESQTIGMAVKARELEAKGVNVIKLNFGEPDFQTPDHIKEAAKKAIDDGFTFYTPVPGIPDLRKAIADKFKRENNLTFAPEQIVVSTGAKQSLTNVLLCLLNPGDEAIVLSPYWVSYKEMVKMAEAEPVFVAGTIENDFIPSKEQLKDIADLVAENPNIMVIADEIYEHILFDGKHESIGQFENIKNQTVIVNGFSKGYAMTGWRVGYVGAPLWLAKACDKMQGQVTSGTCSIAQKASIAALNGTNEPREAMRQAFHRRRDLVKGLLDAIPGVKTNLPKGAFYIFPDVSHFFGKSFNGEKIKDCNDLCMFLLNEAHVSLVSGDAFGDPNCIRISFAAADEQLIEAITRIKNGLAKLV